MTSIQKYTTGALLLLIFFSLYVYLEQSGELHSLFQLKNLQIKLQQIGNWGPLFIIMLMTGAIVMSPRPSAPIAIAAGLVYGHSWGTLYILIGAEIGALIAFSISRLLGYDAMQKRFGSRIKNKYLSSSNHIMFVIFVTRLIPFISFDIISYAAGLTKISYFKFALATLAGILPASFLLAHFGGEMASDDTQRMMTTILLLGLLTLMPVFMAIIKKCRKVSE